MPDAIDNSCAYCLGVRIVGWSGMGPIACPTCSPGKDSVVLLTQAWVEQTNQALALTEQLQAATRKASEVPGLSATLDETRWYLGRAVALLKEAKERRGISSDATEFLAEIEGLVNA